MTARDSVGLGRARRAARARRRARSRACRRAAVGAHDELLVEQRLERFERRPGDGAALRRASRRRRTRPVRRTPSAPRARAGRGSSRASLAACAGGRGRRAGRGRATSMPSSRRRASSRGVSTPDAPRGELDRQRQPVEAPADRGDHRSLLRRDRVVFARAARSAGTARWRRCRRAARAGSAARRESAAARGWWRHGQAGRRGQEVGDQRRGVEHVLEVVEDQQALAGRRGDARAASSGGAPWRQRHLERVGDRQRHVLGRGHGRERHEVAAGRRAAELEREAGLADAAGPTTVTSRARRRAPAAL